MTQISLVNYSQLRKARRLDAEFFKPKHLQIEKLVCQKLSKTLRQLRASVVSGPFGSTLKSNAYRKTGIPFVRISNLSSFFIDSESLVFIDEVDHERIKSSELWVGDLVLSKVGNTIGVVSKVTSNIGKCNISENNIGIKLRDLDDDAKNYVLLFLNCIYGQRQINRYISGNAQPKLNVSDIANIQIMFASDQLKKILSKTIDKAHCLYSESALLFSQAEQTLLNAIGLEGWKPSSTLSYVKNYHQASQAQRIDAEYFHPKFQEMFGNIPAHIPLDRLGKLTIYTKGVEVGRSAYTDSGVPFWRVSNLSKRGLDNSNANFISQNLYESLRQNYEARQGEILLSKDASPGLAYYIENPIQGIVSSGILRLEIIDTIPPHYLELVLNSLFVQMQIERDEGGSVIKHWKPSEVRKTLIPRLSDDKEKEIARLVQLSHGARREAKALLEKAKRAVEIAIEENEERAIEFIG